MFSLVNALLLRMLPVERPQELVLLSPVDERGNSLGFSYPLFEAVRDHSHTLAGIFALSGGPMNVSVDGQAELAPGGGQYVSGSYFSTLGVRAVAGRTFTAEDDEVPGQHPVAVISYNYWKRRFARDPSAVGKTIYLNGHPFTVIGVTPPRFFGISTDHSPDVTVPMMMYPQLNPDGPDLNNRGSWWLKVMARLKPGVSAPQATADANVALQQYLAEDDSAESRSQRTWGLRAELEPGAWGNSPRSKPEAWKGLGILMGLVGLVLLIACANIANLLLARGAARQKEIALRLSIGAGRWRLIRQLLTESLLLAVFGGAAGLLLAFWGTEGLAKLVAQSAGPALDLSPDTRVLGFTAAISLLTGVLFGLAPAFGATRVELTTALKEGGRQWSTGPVRNRLRSALVVSQVALSLVLLVVAALFTRSLEKLLSVDLGFRPEHVLVLSVDPTLVGYQGARLDTLYKSLLERLDTIPGVLSASASRGGLLERGGWHNLVTVPGYTPRPGEEPGSGFNPVGSHFFETAGIPILLGRDFGPRDDETAPKVAVVNETFARDFFGGANPLGRTIGLGVNQNLGQFEIVGVVKDSKQNRLSERPVRVVYFPFLQIPPALISQMTLEVRTAADPAAMTATVRKELLAVEKNLPIFGVKTLTQQVQDSLGEQRMVARLTTLFGLLALLLAAVGLYGVMSYSVARRTSEIGIRMALGAQRGDVTRLVLRETMTLVSVGVALGLAGALGAGRVLSSLLFGLAPTDPVAFAAATLLLTGVAAVASYVPARRASQVDPMAALRYE
ncbi:MAG: multidrug ABC transporter substrate-binding protein [Acidobacteria bacterium]|nr:MAG: multidrug ABC transporter substrate-binding protein [Acidobacteriota bacterium]